MDNLGKIEWKWFFFFFVKELETSKSQWIIYQ